MREPAVYLLRVASLVALAFTAATAVEYYLGGHTFCEPAGGCDLVRYSRIGHTIAPFLPALGLIVFPIVFAGSLVRHRRTLRWAAGLAVLAGLGALLFLALQGLVIGHWCWLCVGVDTAAVVCGAAGGWILRARIGEEDGTSSMVSLWWPLFFAAFAPIAWALTVPDPPVPEAIRELWDPSADVNVVEMADFECPYCRRMHPVLEGVLEDVDGEVHVARIIVPLEFHPNARGAARAYFCADAQGAGDAMAARLFEGDIEAEALPDHAAALDLDLDAFADCLDAPETAARVEADLERSRRARMQGLPSVYIGERVVLGFREDQGAAPYEAAVEAALRGDARRVRVAPFAILALLMIASGLGALWLRRREAASAK